MVFRIIERPSPNFNERPQGGAGQIDTVIIHYTGMKTCDDALERLCWSEAEVSAHYLIGEAGACYCLVPPEKRAWHAGVSYWQGRDNLNHTSIGIELVNPGHDHGYRAFPQRQIRSLLDLLESLKPFNIPRQRYLGHSDIAPDRKLDPGELFPWHELAQAGYGVVPQCQGLGDQVVAALGDAGAHVTALKEMLGTIGYQMTAGPKYCDHTFQVVCAVQRHWRQSRVSGVYDQGTQEIVTELMYSLA